MKRCSVRPYEGADNYIFVSYCHQDKQMVYPIIERLARDGYRVWYDEGINPGADWPEVIADHLSRCALCIAFLSDHALNSHNCRREINFTLLKRKPLISVAIENVTMSPGMQMQLSSAQLIAKVGMTDDEFFGMLYRSPLLSSSQGAPDQSIRISTAEEYRNESYDNAGMNGPSFNDMWFSENENSADYESRKVNVTYHPTYQPDPQTIRAFSQQKSEHTKVYSKEEFNREASLKPIKMKSDIRRVEEVHTPIQNDGQRHLKWLIPLMIVLMVLTLALSIVAVILSRSGDSIKSQLPPILGVIHQREAHDRGYERHGDPANRMDKVIDRSINPADHLF